MRVYSVHALCTGGGGITTTSVPVNEHGSLLYPLYIYTHSILTLFILDIYSAYIYILNGSWFPARKPFSITDISSLPAPWWPLRPGSALAVEKRGSILVLECDGQI